MKKLILFFLLLLSVAPFSRAAVESFVERREGNQLVVSSTIPSITVYDNKYSQMATNPAWTSVFSNYKVKNVLRVGINPDAPQTNDLSGSITFTIRSWRWNTATSSFTMTTETNRVLSLMYSFTNPNTIIDEIASYTFSDAHKVEVFITAITGATFDVNDVFVSSEIEVERYYSLNSTPVTGLGVTVPSDNTEYYQFDWNQKIGAEYYELEWVHISDATMQTGVYKPQSGLKYDYYLNSTRIVVKGNSYRIPRILDRGYLIYRIRPVGLVGTNFATRMEGAWTNAAESGTVASHLAANVLFIGSDYDIQMNWSHQVAYGDNGERFESVSFVDGLGRGRQSVGHNTETQQAVVSNVYYDELGRPVISDLPTPVDGEVLRHRKDFNLANVAGTPSFQQLYFDVPSEDICNPVAGGFANSSGSGKYYSGSNPDQDGENSRIPDAENHPFTRVTYLNDFTGRVDKVSGFGDDLKIGSGKETSFAYPSPNQAELDRLFGAEVGQASHYQKMVTIDANGQIYIQYSDMAGRVVASYMAGSTPDGIDPLDGNGEQNVITEILPQNDQTISDVLPSSTLTYTEFITQNASYVFDYAFTPKQFQDACMQENVCLDCVYDFTISIVDKCGEEIFSHGQSFIGADLDNLCSPKAEFSYTTLPVPLTVGAYTIIKTLKVNQQAIQDNWCNYVDNATCLDPLSNLFNEEYTQEQFPFCSVEVDAEELGECDARRAIMLQDLSPGGQYGLFVNTNGNYTALLGGASVHSVLTEDALGTDMDWKHPLTPYLNEDGSTAYVGGVLPQNLSFQDFVSNFQPSWANSLITYHPEYCFLQFCDNNAASNAYNQSMLDTYTFSSACSAGFFKPLASSQNINPLPCASATTNFDPFFAAGGQGAGQYSSMLSDMSNYQSNGFSIWQHAIYQAFCNGSGDIFTCLDNFRNSSPADQQCFEDLIWVKYREMYLALKQQKIYAVQQANTSCSNAHVGVNANWINNVAVWGNAANLPDADGDGFPENGSNLDLTEFETYMDAQVAAQCQSACEDYADDWLMTLQGCEQIAALSSAQQTNLRNDLIDLCKSGCNSDHPMGASTSPTGQTIDDILSTYISNYEDEFCTGLLISNPGPYQSPAELQGLVVKPLDTCACNEILTAKWDIDNNVNNPNNYNLEQLIASRTGVSLEDANYLICACDMKFTVDVEPYDPETTVWLPSAPDLLQQTGITIPAGLACSSGNGCTDCSEISILMTALNDRFETVTDFVNTANYPVILTNYLNTELHFTLSYYDYLTFIGKCGATTENPYCTVNPLMYEWLDVMKLIAFRGMLLRPSTNPVDLMTDNIVFANGEWRDDLNGNNYWSSASGNVLTAYFGNDLSSNCQFQLTLPVNATFGFDDIVSFGSLTPLTSSCSSANNSFTVTVSYYDCGSLTTATLTGTSSCFEVNECVCSSADLKLCDEIPEPESICYQPRLDELYQNALAAYDNNIEELYDDYVAGYKSACAAAFDTEKFKHTGPQNVYQFTLFFYDQAGNLVKTVAPEGIPASFNQANVNAARNSVNSYTSFTPVSSFAPISPFPNNSFETVYTYNSYNQLVATVNPDQIDSTKYWYDFYGRMVASQNPVQADDKKYSYVLYDVQGRPIEVGQIDRDVPPSGGGPGFTLGVLSETTHLKVDDLGVAFKNWVYSGTRTEVTYTVYDQPMAPAIAAKFASGTQQNLRLRVASVVYFDAVSSATMPLSGYVSATHYSYDLHGNVLEALQDVPALAPVQQDVKSTQYTFALLSGNVKKVEYQKGKRDRMTHEYLYDKLFRLAEVFTSTDDGVHKSREAHYRYFDYGPLARLEIGEHKVQGNDFTYTINGWLKGMNSTTLDRTRDAGRDGSTGYLTTNSRVNESVARDVTGFMMGYFSGDYKSINSGTTFEASIGSGNNLTNAIKQLYNGNIAYTTTAIDGYDIQAGVYTYDQLQRLKQMRVFRSTTLNSLNNWSGAVETQEYSSSYTYDRNGNLKTLIRKGTNAGGINMDDFAYNYVLGSNRLTHVTDGAGTTSYNDDIEPGQTGTNNVPITGVHTSDNYQYDKLGQLITDVQEGLTMQWRFGDKKLKLQKNSSKQLEFVYNPFGQRVYKVEKKVVGGTVQGQTASEPWKYTYYSYDANGQVMATYSVVMNTSNSVNTAALDEQMIYGSGRIGLIQSENNNFVFNQAPVPYAEYTFTNSNDLWSNCNQSSMAVSATQLNVSFWGTNNCISKSISTVSGQNYTVRVKSSKGTTTGLSIEAWGSSLISTQNLNDNVFTSYTFQANSANTTLIIKPVSATSGSYSVDEVSVSDASGWKNRLGLKNYELTNHLGNVNAVITDRKMVSDGAQVYAQHYFDYTTEGWSATSGTLSQSNGQLSLVSGNNVSRTISVEAGKTYSIDITATKGSGMVPNLELFLSGVTPSITPLTSGATTSLTFTASTTNPSLGIVIRATVAGNYNFQVQEVVIKSHEHYDPVVIMKSDYYPFGMQMPGRFQNTDKYRYAYNGMEQDPETKGNGNSYTTEFRQYDPRLGRWLSLDPLMMMFPHQSPYCAFDNNPIYFTDPYGLSADGPGDPPVGHVCVDENNREQIYMGNDEWSTPDEVNKLIGEKDQKIKSLEINQKKINQQISSIERDLKQAEQEATEIEERIEDAKEDAKEKIEAAIDIFEWYECEIYGVTGGSGIKLPIPNYYAYLEKKNPYVAPTGYTPLNLQSGRCLPFYPEWIFIGGSGKIFTSALAGALFSGGSNFLGQFISNGFSFRKVDYASVGLSTVSGAITKRPIVTGFVSTTFDAAIDINGNGTVSTIFNGKSGSRFKNDMFWGCLGTLSTTRYNFHVSNPVSQNSFSFVSGFTYQYLNGITDGKVPQ